jgi:hypothetical protein
MRWIGVRKANIEKNVRDHFEEFGVEIVRAYFTQPVGTPIWRNAGESVTTVQDARQHMQLWLREQYDRAERGHLAYDDGGGHHDTCRRRTPHVNPGFLLPTFKVAHYRNLGSGFQSDFHRRKKGRL